MLEYSHGEIGWDVFTLEYKVDAPIDTVLDPESMMKYLKLFNHLWQMRRVEGALSKGWMRIAGGARTFLRVPGNPHCLKQTIGQFSQRVFSFTQILNPSGTKSA